jgi:predicted GNAT superfamily acetyltransferase
MSELPIITTRPLETVPEFLAAIELQRQIWPGTDLDVVPLHLLTTIAHNGGLVLGSFHGDRMVGFLLGFLGTDEGQASRPAMTRLKHCSHMLGVLPEYRGQQIGYQLKLAQRDFVAFQGVRLITWTFDPLESRNARLNIAKLGSVCSKYLREPYGEMGDALNAAVPADRFQVDWWITSPRVKERMFGQRAPLILESFTSAGTPLINPTQPGPDDLPRPAQNLNDMAGTVILIEIPANYQAIKANDLSLAHAWRTHTRDLFESAFHNGYWVTDFLYERVDGRQRSFYALSEGEHRIEVSEN